jgi:RNA:NAD 2'-phosphotransferase (TPT1/KptA family)
MKKILTQKDKQQIKTLLEEMLRKDPAHFGLNTDAFGAVPLEDLALAASRQIPWIQLDYIIEIASESHSDLLIEDGLIQYRSGQHFPVVHPEPLVPPAKLYLATNAILVNTWLHSGAEPLLKRYLLLFAAEDEAWHHATAVESIHSPTVFTVAALKASQGGVQFYVDERTYFCKKIPAVFLKL